MLTYIDLFAGTSALSEGFRLSGFVPVAHVEADINCCLTIKTRNAYHYLKKSDNLGIYYDYLRGRIDREYFYSCLPEELSKSVIHREISDVSINDIFNTITRLIKPKTKMIDMIVGGPPCQAFSLRGRHLIDFEHDKRLTLYIQYGKFLQRFHPKAFVFENVPGILNAKKGEYFNHLQEYFRSIGYETDYRILNAKDYGVLQSRQRVVIIGWKKKLDFEFPDIEKVSHQFTTKDIFSDLSALEPGQVMEHAKYRTRMTPYQKHFSLRNEGGFYTQHITRPHNPNDLKIYRYAIERWNNGHQRLKYTEVPPKLQTQQNKTTFLDRFKVVDGDGISHTVVAHIAKDGHYYIHPDIEQCRSISVREAARIQSFPDDYYFEGSRASMFRQIGNAVPPLMALAVAKGVQKILSGIQ